MTEETVAEASAFMGALNQAWNVGDDEAVVIDHNGPEFRLKGGEGIVGDLRAWRGKRQRGT